MPAAPTTTHWLVLVFQFPKGAGSERVRIWRRLQRVGAVALKSSVYVLPTSEQTREDFQWLLTELQSGGAEATLMTSRIIDGMSDEDVRDLFKRARDSDYEALIEDLDAAATTLVTAAPDHESVVAARQALARAKQRFASIESVDFFGANRGEAAQAAIWTLTDRLAALEPPATDGERTMKQQTDSALKDRVWVTRRNIRVDRIASAWLIRRWINPEARFKFVDGRDYVPEAGEVRFDMFEGEFTHEGDLCTLEVLAARVAPNDEALRCVGEIVHDIDLKDGKFARPETDGVAGLVSGLVASVDDDNLRVERGAALFESLYGHFRQTRA